MSRAFVIGDVHGMYEMLVELLDTWNSDTEHLILLGDMIDRGPQIKEVIDLARKLQIEHSATLLRGNHEQMLLDCLNAPEQYWGRYQRNGGLSTFAALLEVEESELQLQPIEQIVTQVTEKLPWLIQWLTDLPLYEVFGHWICVHAGLDLTLADWRKTSTFDMVWIRNEFHQAQNNTGKYIIFGHTPLQNLNKARDSLAIWQQDGKFGIDGGAVYQGDLIGLLIEENGDILQERRVKGKRVL